MSRGLNKVMLIGHLGRDPEISYGQSGIAICKLNLATTERRRNADGQWDDHTEWHRVVCFGKTAEAMSQYLKKGGQIYLEGRLQTRNWERDGQKHWMTEIIANQIFILGRREEGGGRQSEPDEETDPRSQPSADDMGTDVEDDLPF